MTRELALGTVLAGFEGQASPPDWLRRRLAEGLGGVALFGRNVRDDEQVARLVEAIHAEAPAVVAIDEEGGDVTRLDVHTGSAFPGALALGAAGDSSLTRQVATELGARLAALGIDLDLAPVADLLLDPASPIVGVRSFGADPDAAAAQVAAFVEGLQAQGVGACLKHFPGHGATAGDSHRELPEIAGGEAGLEAALAPFSAGIRAGAYAVMTAHVVVRHLDRRPATLSAPIMEGLLRKRLGFGGLVVTDGLDMGGITQVMDGRSAAPAALAAGVDALLLGGGPADEDAVERTVAAILAEPPPPARLEAACERMRLLAGWADLTRRSRPAPAGGSAEEAARRALRMSGRVEVVAPITLVELAEEPSEAAGPVPLALGEALGAACVVRVELCEVERAGQAPPLQGAIHVIVVRNLHRHPWQQSFVAEHPEAVVVELGVPVLEPAGVRGYVATNGASRVSCEAAAAVMLGTRVGR